MAYIKKTTFNIDGITIHSSFSILVNCKNLPSLNLEQLNNLVKKYDQLQLIIWNFIHRENNIKVYWFSIKINQMYSHQILGNIDVIKCREFYQV